jgi:hypothetical protein
MIETQLKPITAKLATEVEKAYQEFQPGNIGNRKDCGFEFDKGMFQFLEKDKKWMREVEIKPKPPKFFIFMIYGDFTVLANKLNFAIFRIPYKGIKWHKEVIPAIKRWFQKELKSGRMIGGKERIKKYTRKTKLLPYWYVESDATYTNKSTFWGLKKPQKFDYRNGEFVKVK